MMDLSLTFITAGCATGFACMMAGSMIFDTRPNRGTNKAANILFPSGNSIVFASMIGIAVYMVAS
jgi:hypothetical protein